MFKIPVFIIICFSFLVNNAAAQKLDLRSAPQIMPWYHFQDLRNRGLPQDEVKFLDSVIANSMKDGYVEDFYKALSEYNASLIR